MSLRIFFAYFWSRRFLFGLFFLKPPGAHFMGGGGGGWDYNRLFSKSKILRFYNGKSHSHSI